MRLFVAVHPPESVLEEVARVAAALPGAPGVRPTARSSWHVTLRFLGEVAEPAPVVAALDAIRPAAAEAILGPTVTMLGRQVVVIPIAGLDALAAEVAAATAGFGQPPDDRPFHGHVTLARLKRGSRPRLVRPVLGTPITSRWTPTTFALVQSHLSDSGPTYEDVSTWPIRGGA